ncbi:MAG: 3-hydroxyisobutyrate dehydrogenase-like beta-hydroxyacid dehydrogenase [Acidimicrobiales bacterium]|jgi:3-hydroxyisobutyrate dehydrogenase-like beta-hydroxyacid dehydrogenase
MAERAVGFVGLGVMGEPMCRNVLRSSGRSVVVFDQNPDAVARLVDAGAEAASNLADLAGRVEIVHLSLPGGPELEAVLDGAAGLLTLLDDSQTIVDHTTAPYGLTTELAAKAAKRGVAYCDAPVARTRQAAIDGTLSIMVGGDAADVARITPLLECMAEEVSHCGPAGAGQVAKLLNNVILVQNLNAVAEAHAIVQGLGLDPAVIFDTLTKGSGDSFALRSHGHKAVLADDYPLQAFPTRYQLKDASYAIELAEDAGVDAKGAQLAKQRLEAAIEAGYVEEYWPVIRKIV